MTLRGRFLLGLLVAAIVIMIGVKLFLRGEVQAVASIIFATLVMAVNLWEWFWPDIIKQFEKTGGKPRKLILLSLLAIAIGLMVGVYLLWPGRVQLPAVIILAGLALAANGWEWFKPDLLTLIGKTGMEPRKFILLCLLGMAIALMIGESLFWKGDAWAVACIILTLCVMAANVWEWFKPETGEQVEADRIMLRRIILLVLALFAFGMMILESYERPGKAVGFLCIIYAVPVIVANLWEYLRTFLGDIRPLTWRRKILLGLLAAAALIGTAYAYWPDVWLEYAFLVFTVPVALANGLEWFDPESMEKMVQVFGKRTISARNTKHEG